MVYTSGVALDLGPLGPDGRCTTSVWVQTVGVSERVSAVVVRGSRCGECFLGAHVNGGF